MLLPFFGMILPTIPHLACGANEINPQYAQFYYLQWTIIQVSEQRSISPVYIRMKSMSHIIFCLDHHDFFCACHIDDYYGYSYDF